MIMDNFTSIIKFIRFRVMEKYLFLELMKLITWISTENPAGFKLNTDLGKFLGDLYIWTIDFVKILSSNLIEAANISIIFP